MVAAKRVVLLGLFILCFASVPSIPSGASELIDALKSRDWHLEKIDHNPAWGEDNREFWMAGVQIAL